MSLTRSSVSSDARIRWRSCGNYAEGHAPRSPSTRYAVHNLHPGYGAYARGALIACVPVANKDYEAARQRALDLAQAHADDDARQAAAFPPVDGHGHPYHEGPLRKEQR